MKHEMVLHALALAEQGFKVFPITPLAKSPPLIKDWQRRATTDPEIIKQFWLATPEANIGIHCEGLLVLDIDPKNGGEESYAKLDMMYGFPETMSVRTPSGGRHLYYRLPEGHSGVPNSVGTLGAGLDVRSTGGYVVGPGSVIAAGEYSSDE
jgi:hypothetical protein